MFWTLLLLLTVGWMLALLTNAGAPLVWVLPAAIVVLFVYRMAGAFRRG